jgi:hypothetical protein
MCKGELRPRLESTRTVVVPPAQTEAGRASTREDHLVAGEGIPVAESAGLRGRESRRGREGAGFGTRICCETRGRGESASRRAVLYAVKGCSLELFTLANLPLQMIPFEQEILTRDRERISSRVLPRAHHRSSDPTHLQSQVCAVHFEPRILGPRLAPFREQQRVAVDGVEGSKERRRAREKRCWVERGGRVRLEPGRDDVFAQCSQEGDKMLKEISHGHIGGSGEGERLIIRRRTWSPSSSRSFSLWKCCSNQYPARLVASPPTRALSRLTPPNPTTSSPTSRQVHPSSPPSQVSHTHLFTLEENRTSFQLQD